MACAVACTSIGPAALPPVYRSSQAITPYCDFCVRRRASAHRHASGSFRTTTGIVRAILSSLGRETGIPRSRTPFESGDGHPSTAQQWAERPQTHRLVPEPIGRAGATPAVDMASPRRSETEGAEAPITMYRNERDAEKGTDVLRCRDDLDADEINGRWKVRGRPTEDGWTEWYSIDIDSVVSAREMR